MDDLTGRDEHIITTALAIAVEAINAIPPRAQPWSDQQDMKKMLDRMIADNNLLAMTAKLAARRVQAIGQPDDWVPPKDTSAPW